MEIILKYFADFTAIQLEQFRLLESLYKERKEKINVVLEYMLFLFTDGVDIIFFFIH